MTLTLRWDPPPEPPRLGPAEVHVWAAGLDRPDAELGALWETLSADERERAERFRFERDRRRFIAARGTLRALLSHYLKSPPETFHFSYSPYGKPALSDGALSFNLSHSQALALVALARAGPLGVDVEQVRADFATLSIAEQFFSPAEVAALRPLPDDERVEAFFNCWTRKEAFVKALGEGLSFPLKAFDVSLRPGEPAALLRADGDPEAASRWRIQALSPAAGYVAALAVRDQAARVQEWRWG